MAATLSFGDANTGFQAGIINGPVSTTYLSPERRSTPPPPSIVIPFNRDTDFIERGTILKRVEQICASPDAQAALVGLGGVGKSQLAIEYAYRTRDQSPETWVFWAHASNAARFEQSFRDIADRVEIAGRQDPQANIFKLVHDWMCRTKERWLLVLDNVDDARFLLDVRADQGGRAANSTGAARPLRDYLPHCERGSILVTSRSKDAALKLVEQRNVLNVEPMDQAEGVALFEKKLVGVQKDSSDIAELAAVLDHMPLAIAQAAAYISQRAPRSSVRKYLDEFRKSETNKTKLLSDNEQHLRRDWEAKNSILITWWISFEYIQQIRPSATDLLSLMSFFDRQGIPEALLHRRNMLDLSQVAQQEDDDQEEADPQPDDSSSEPGIDDEFEEDVILLRNFCFISTGLNGTTFEMHALVQLATRIWLTENSKLEHWKQQFVAILKACFPENVKYENWEECHPLYAHVKAAVERQPEDESALVDWSDVLYRAACFAEDRGNFADAEMLVQKAIEAQKKILGQEHMNTLRSMGFLGSIHGMLGRLKDAERLEVQVLEAHKMKLGADHLDTLISMNNLALIWKSQGRLDDAERLQVQALEAHKMKLGADHPDTLRSMNNLALTYANQGRLDDAERLQVQVLEARKMKLGADHPNTLNSMNNLALTWKDQGRLDDAERLQVQVLEARKMKLGADHPDTLTSMSNLALMYANQGRLDDTERLEVQVLEAHKMKLGADHPNTLRSMNNLAATYADQGRLDDAERLQVQALEAHKMKLGADHPDTLISMNNLALIWKSQGRRAEVSDCEG